MDELTRVGNAELLKFGGVLITEVERDSPAWEAKLQPGLFIAEVGGQKITSPREFRHAILGKNGQVALKVFGSERVNGLETRIIEPSAR